jgi:hypothetical protein
VNSNSATCEHCDLEEVLRKLLSICMKRQYFYLLHSVKDRIIKYIYEYEYVYVCVCVCTYIIIQKKVK